MMTIFYSHYSTTKSYSEISAASAPQDHPPVDSKANPDAHERISFFKETAKGLSPMTDKVGTSGRAPDKHRYHNMYGMFLLPIAASKPTFKFFEIGLGCDMRYGPGASITLWKKLFPKAELWEAEHDATCVENQKKKNQLDGINVLVGDQGKVAVLDSWIEKSGGNFDVIIDDGGHTNCQIGTSFDKLWPQVNPGGYYFIEDLHVGRYRHYKDNCPVMADKVKDWIEQLIFMTQRKSLAKVEHKLPKDLIFVHCQAEACVLGKRHSEINDPVVLQNE